MRNGSYRTHQSAHRIFAVTALDGHYALWRTRHMQPWIRLQADGAVRLCTGGNTGEASDTSSVVSNYKVIHGVALFAQHERKDGLSSIHNYNKRSFLSSDARGFFKGI